LSLLAAAGLTLLAPGTGRAANAVTYRSTPLVQSGYQFGTIQIPANDDLYAGGLTDDGQITFSAGVIGGSRPEMLLQGDGRSVWTIAAPASGPVGAYTGDIYWPKDVITDRPVNMNNHGNVVFTADHAGKNDPWGTFMWDAAKQKVVSIALKDMPATGNLTFLKPGGSAPAINNSNEIAFAGQVKGPNGPNGWGLFLEGIDGLHSICLSHQALPSADGLAKAATDAYFMPSINDTGDIAFVTRRSTGGQHSAYRWQNGATDALLLVGQKVEGGAKITDVASAFLNSHDGSGLIMATTDQGGGGRFGLYRVQNGQVRADVAPGMTMPGGGILRTVQAYYTYDEGGLPEVGVSAPNAAGQQVFQATLMDGTQAAYRLDPNGALTLAFQVMPPTGSAHIAEVTLPAVRLFVPGSRPVLNNQGQVALSVRLAGGGSMILLLDEIQP
jgi:hypothetical protein